MRAFPSGSSSAALMRTPIRGTRARCCARAAIGHVTVALPTSPMNSRRFTAAPKLRTSHRNGYPTSFKQGNVPSARGLAYARIDKNNLAGRTIGSSEALAGASDKAGT